mmetsp:Transcript_8770/g.37056  ORF Transcript_8770/g.37056 Transcript_8770/m.37056 type:complete len:221 (-) Transcript_8770:761-1423(-)
MSTRANRYFARLWRGTRRRPVPDWWITERWRRASCRLPRRRRRGGRKPTVAWVSAGARKEPTGSGRVTTASAWSRRWRSFRSPPCLTAAAPGTRDTSRSSPTSGSSRRCFARRRSSARPTRARARARGGSTSTATAAARWTAASLRRRWRGSTSPPRQRLWRRSCASTTATATARSITARCCGAWFPRACATASETPSRPCATCATSAPATSPWKPAAVL